MSPSPAALTRVPLAAVASNPRNPRRALTDIEDLAESIRQVGILEPMVVSPASWQRPTGRCPDCDQNRPLTTTGVVLEHPSPPGTVFAGGPCPGGGQPAADLYRLLFGHRRYAAAVAAGLTEADVVVRHDLRSDVDQLVAMLTENGQRADLTPVEEADAYSQLELFGLRPIQIAHRLGRSRRRVERRLALLALPEGTQERVHTHQVSLAEAEALVEFADDPATVRALDAAAGTDTWRWELQRARERRHDAHHPPLPRPAEQPTTPAVDPAVQTRARHREDLRTAAGVRSQWLTDLEHATGPATAIDATALRRAVTALARSLWEAGDSVLHRPALTSWHDRPDAAAYLRLLQGLGYELTDFEERMLTDPTEEARA